MTMFRHIPLIRTSGLRSLSTVKPSPSASVEPEFVAPRKSGVDVFCQKIKKLGPRIDWEEFRSNYNPLTRKFDRIFETRVMDCLIVQSSDEEPGVDDLRRSFLQYLRTLDMKNRTFENEPPQNRTSEKKPLQNRTSEKRPFVFDMGYCALLGKVDPVSHADEIAELVKRIVTEKPTATKYPTFIHCISALSSSSRQNCLLAVNLFKNHRLTTFSFEVIVRNCLKFGLFDHAVFFSSNLDTLDVGAWIESFHENFEKNSRDEESWIKFLESCQQRNQSVPVGRKKQVEGIFNQIGFQGQKSGIDSCGSCSSCGSLVRQISQKDCDVLREVISKEVLRGCDVFLNTNPEEVKNFIRFIDSRFQKGSYYDLVVDGLNVVHCRQATVWVPESKHSERKFTSYKDIYRMSENFQLVMSRVLKQFQKVLIIGRDHMFKLPDIEKCINSAKGSIDLYSLRNDSNDDAFILNAGVRSPKTYLLTNDLYRNHLALLNDDHQLFIRWLSGRHILVNDLLEGKPKPPLYDICVNVSNDSRIVHVPFQGKESVEWKCFRK